MFTVAPWGPRAIDSHLSAALSICRNLTNPMGAGSTVSHLQLHDVVGNIQHHAFLSFPFHSFPSPSIHFLPLLFPSLTQKSWFSTSLAKPASNILLPCCPQPFLVLCFLLLVFCITKLPLKLSSRSFLRIWENGKNEFSLQGLEDGKYKHINTFILSYAYVYYLLVLSLWLDLYSSPQHLLMIIWFSVMFLFFCKSPAFSFFSFLVLPQ